MATAERSLDAARTSQRNGYGSSSSGVIITPGLSDGTLSRPSKEHSTPRRTTQSERRESRIRALLAIAVMGLAFFTVGSQLIHLALQGQNDQRIAMSAPIATAFARPDIVDRNGRLLAGDIVMQSLIADPSVVLDVEEIVAKLAAVLPNLSADAIRDALSDRSKKFAWLRRGLSTAEAQQIHNLGLPGLDFRPELRRAYPLGRTAGHVLGFVDIDNKGLAGIEQFLDSSKYVEPVHGPSLSARPPLRLSLDVAVQFAVEEELADAMTRYKAKAATGIVMDAKSGKIVAAVSLPGRDPGIVDERFEKKRIDKLTAGTFELGSIFKTMTLAMALDAGTVEPDSIIDVRQQLEVDGYPIKDAHPAGRPLSVTEVFLKSSNVGAAMLALADGTDKQKAFLKRIGLTTQIATEAGPVAPPSLPSRWGDIETVTVAYGHGLAVSPLQFAAAGASLVNGGRKVRPTFLRDSAISANTDNPVGEQVLHPETSRTIRTLMRSNVESGFGTGTRAGVPGIRIGGKTGTAEIAGKGGYREKAVIASFFAAFPIDAPRYVTLVSLFEPTGTTETGGMITAGRNAAPATSRIVARIAPLLGFLPSEQPL